MKKLYLLSCLLLLAGLTFGQATKKRKGTFTNPALSQKETFLDKQWWLGFKAGVNLSQVLVEKRYSALSPGNYDPSLTDKAYDDFSSLGSQATLEVTFYYKGFSFSLQPSFRHSVFTYSNKNEWTDPDNANIVNELNYQI